MLQIPSAPGQSLLIWTIVFTILCTIIILLRFWSAQLQRRKLYADDYMCAFAYLCTLGFSGVNIWVINNGMGAHTEELSEAQMDIMYQGVVGQSFTWLTGTVLFKISLAWLYTRIFPTKPFIYWAYGAMALAASFGITFYGVFGTNCVPIDWQWKHQEGGSCRNLVDGEFASTSINMVSDLYVIALPIAPLWNLQMGRENKIFITFMFSIGLITIAIMAWRLEDTVDQVKNKTDFTIGFCTTLLISSLELWLGLIASCMPTLAPIMTRYLKPVVQKMTGRSSKTSEHYNLRNVNTIGGGGASGPNNARRKYGKLGGTTDPYDVSDENLVHIERGQSREELEDGLNFGPGGIKVKSDVHVTYANRADKQ